ncbi:fluoride efflux transporter CrcB [Allosaccharopolyspora coralli]|uniref:Fluoride-specific ion channel FluC n=1 Tax=Allosaccharopolyspora coralli TaxID=2665642 RepID=A0A5Q3QBV8_9PSEU|nr:fluoride efflux transporter CrcB [Allosaccharopolyspora coralli]
MIVVALGGGLGALARYGLWHVLPPPPGHFPLATFTANVLGCVLIGVLMVLITEVWSAHRLVRPFLGVGILGGFTTFSTYAVEFHELLRSGLVLGAVGYLTVTLLCALVAVILGVWGTRLGANLVRKSEAS